MPSSSREDGPSVSGTTDWAQSWYFEFQPVASGTNFEFGANEGGEGTYFGCNGSSCGVLYCLSDRRAASGGGRAEAEAASASAVTVEP